MDIKSMYSTFELVGNPLIPRDKFFTTNKSNDGFVSNRLTFGIKSSETNVVFMEIFGGYNEKGKSNILTMDKEGNKIEVPWQERNEKSVISLVSELRKTKVQMDDTTAEFITDYDTANFLKDKLSADIPLYVKGNIRYERYKGQDGEAKIITRYIPYFIRVARPDEIHRADALIHFLFSKDSFDNSRYKTEKKLDISGYVTAYDRGLKKPVFVPMNFVINAEKIDITDKKGMELLEYYVDCFKVKGKKYYETQWNASIARGAEEADITESDLSPAQRKQLDLGLITMEKIRADKNKKIKNRVAETRLWMPALKLVDENGHAVVNLETEYVEDDLIIPEVKEEKFESKKDTKPSASKSDEDERERKMRELFGN